MSRVRFGRPPGGVVELVLHGRAITDPEDWLHVEITVGAGAFSGTYFGYLRVDALRAFRDGLAVLAGDDLDVRLDETGRGTATARDESDSALTFALAVDRASLAEELDAALAEFAPAP